MNIVQVAGHLGSDVETRVTPDGTKVSTIRVATNVRRGGRDETIWWRVTLWGDRWDKMLPYFTKGASIIVIGEMQKPEIYTNRDGQQAISLDIRADIVRFSPFGRGERSGNAENAQPAHANNAGGGYPTQQPQNQPQYGSVPAQTTAGTGGHDFGAVREDDIPF
jgi:single-strand DNA-binding protein